MRLGLIARADSRGLGIQTKVFHDQMHPAKTLVVDCPSAQPLPLRTDWYPDATWVHGWPTKWHFREWLQDLDVVYTAETGYGQWLWSEAQRAGVKTVLHANYEFLDRNDRPTQWWAPSMWHFNDFPPGARFMPVPIETERFPTRDFPAARFLHIVGRPAIHDRNGTEDLLRALQLVTADVFVDIRCQQRDYIHDLEKRIGPYRDNVHVKVTTGDTENYWDNYTGSSVLLMPRRFGGLCLPVNEALGAGMPVIMPDVSPNTWLPAEWLVPAGWCSAFRAKQRIDVYSANHEALAAKIDQFANDEVFFKQALGDAARLRDELSWATLKPLYTRTLEEL